MTTIYSTSQDYPDEEFRRRFHDWVARPFRGQRAEHELDPFGWCRRNLGLMALWHLDRGPEDQPGPWTVQDAFRWIEEARR